MSSLLINIDHVATLRNARQEWFPEPIKAALECELAGADGIVFHLREDRRHINDRDVELIKEQVRSKIDFELSLAPEIISICCRTAPHLATLVPERREEVTTEGGLDVVSQRDRITQTIQKLYDAGIGEVALFLDPVPDQIDGASDVGANAVELHTGDYANARTEEEKRLELDRLAAAAQQVHENGLMVHAGHGLDYENVALFRESVSHVHEVSIGFAIIARAVFVGMQQAVREMLALVKPE